MEHAAKGLEAKGDGGGATVGPRPNGKQSGFLALKDMKPHVFNDRDEEWKSWTEDLKDFLDASRPGMRLFLSAIEQSSTAITDFVFWAGQQLELQKAIDCQGLVRERVHLWRALKAFTDTKSDARRVIMTAHDEDGLDAWQRLVQRFSQSVAAKQGIAMHEFSNMVSKPAKSPSETRMLVTELDRRAKILQDITGEKVSDSHFKSILVGILDPTTRQHTVEYHAVGRTTTEV